MNTQYSHTSPESDLANSPIESPFAAVIILDTQITPEWRDEVSRWLVRSGCLFMMAWGVDCVDFHDSVDRASINEFDGEEIPDDKFVLTTWHDDEPLEEVLWFAQHAAHHDAFDQKRLLILDIAHQPREENILKQLASSYDLHVREPE